MKIIASLILSIGWFGIAFTQYELFQIQWAFSELVFKAVANVLTPISLLIASGIFGLSSILSMPRFNIISWFMCALGLVPLVYFYGPLIYGLVQNAL